MGSITVQGTEGRILGEGALALSAGFKWGSHLGGARDAPVIVLHRAGEQEHHGVEALRIHVTFEVRGFGLRALGFRA